jgi:hypothetical protein
VELHYPAYRLYEASRVRTSDAAMAVLVSIRVTHAELANQAPTVYLPDAFLGVPDLKRLNLLIPSALQVIGDSERLLAYMAIPFVLSVHQAYASDCIRMASSPGLSDSDDADDGLIELNEIHQRFGEKTDSVLPQDLVGLFDLLRSTRNRVTHYAGVRGSRLNQKWRTLSPAAQDGWRNVARRDFPTCPASEELPLGIGELIGALMVATRLGREMNAVMAAAVSRSRWARIAVEDFRTGHPTRFGQRATHYAASAVSRTTTTQHSVCPTTSWALPLSG